MSVAILLLHSSPISVATLPLLSAPRLCQMRHPHFPLRLAQNEVCSWVGVKCQVTNNTPLSPSSPSSSPFPKKSRRNCGIRNLKVRRKEEKEEEEEEESLQLKSWQCLPTGNTVNSITPATETTLKQQQQRQHYRQQNLTPSTKQLDIDDSLKRRTTRTLAATTAQKNFTPSTAGAT